MEFWGDDRGQSVQVGAILLFGILIIALATVQATVVPEQNAAAEFDHSRAVQSDMQDLRNALLAAADGGATPTRVKLGTTYANRFFFVNPPPATGELRTVGADDPAVNVTIRNANGSVQVGGDHENAREYWANAPEAGVYDTAGVEYVPGYSRYDGAPTTQYGNSVLFNTFDNGANRTLTGQRIVKGNTIDLLALRGDLDETGVGAETVELTALSEQARTVTVESEPDDPLYVNVTSRLSASVWNENLLGSNANASVVGTVPVDGNAYHRIAIRLDEGTYRLRGAAVGVGAVSDTERENVTEPAYLVVTDGYEPVANGSEGTLTVEVRDRFNNPVTGATVNASADGQYLRLLDDGTELNETTFTTDAEGRAEIAYRGVESTAGDGWLNTSIGSESYEQARFEGLAVPTFQTGGGDGGELNPGATGDLIFTSANLNSGGGGSETVDLVFNNTLPGSVNVTTIRLNFYYDAATSQGGGQPSPTYADVTVDGESSPRATEVNIGGNYRNVDPDISVASGGSNYQFTLDFDAKVASEDFFVFSLVFEYEGQTYRETYFANPQ